MSAMPALLVVLFKQTTRVYAKPRGFSITKRIILVINALRIVMRVMQQGALAVLTVSILILKAAAPKSACHRRRTLVDNALIIALLMNFGIPKEASAPN